MAPQLGGKTKLQLLVPSRGLIGYRAEFMVDTHGTGVMNRVIHGYLPYKGNVDKVRPATQRPWRGAHDSCCRFSFDRSVHRSARECWSRSTTAAPRRTRSH